MIAFLAFIACETCVNAGVIVNLDWESDQVELCNGGPTDDQRYVDQGVEDFDVIPEASRSISGWCAISSDQVLPPEDGQPDYCLPYYDSDLGEEHLQDVLRPA